MGRRRAWYAYSLTLCGAQWTLRCKTANTWFAFFCTSSHCLLQLPRTQNPQTPPSWKCQGTTVTIHWRLRTTGSYLLGFDHVFFRDEESQSWFTQVYQFAIEVITITEIVSFFFLSVPDFLRVLEGRYDLTWWWNTQWHAPMTLMITCLENEILPPRISHQPTFIMNFVFVIN